MLYPRLVMPIAAVFFLSLSCTQARPPATSAAGGARAGAGGAPAIGGTMSGGGGAGGVGNGGLASAAVSGGGAGGGPATSGGGSGGAGGGAMSGGSGGAGGDGKGGVAGGGAPGVGGNRSGTPVAFVTPATFTGNDNPAAPLAGILRLTTDVPATVQVTVSGGDETWTLDLPAATDFTKPILGLKPATTYTLSLTASAGDNTLTAGPLAWTTPALPASFVPFAVPASDPGRMEPGMTMFAVRDGWNMAQAPILIVDGKGALRWYFADPQNLVQEDLIQLDNGHFFFGKDFCNLREIDLLGNVVAAWHAAKYPRTCTTVAGSIPVDTTDFHHESHILPNGNILTLSTETRTIDNFPTSEDDPKAARKSALVMGSAIVEFTPQGQIVKRIPMLDLLDPTRIGRDALDPSWPAQHELLGQRAYDWDHANAVIYDEASDAYVVSLRHQDAVVKISRADSKVLWILGTPANWVSPWKDLLLAPVGDLLWPFHQHAVELNALGLGVYDNGNYRAAAYETVPTTPEWSRAVIYSIDEAARTVKQVWSYGPSSGADSFFSTGMGDADRQSVTGNVLLTNAQLVAGGDAAVATTYAQILEVTPDGTRVFELSTRGKDGTTYPVYRADRIPDIRR